MSRRSSRLLSGGYYNSDEESDSSSVTNISYRENPVKVFKKKAVSRKSSSRTSSRANSHVESSTLETTVPAEQHEDLSPSPSSRLTQTTMRTLPYTPTSPTPRPPLTPSSSRGHTPTRCCSLPPQKSPPAVPGSSSRPPLHFSSSVKQLSQSGVDSSGYSSSEGNYRKYIPPSSREEPGGGFSVSECRSSIIRFFYRQIDSASLMAAAVHSKILHAATLAANPPLSSGVKKACGLFLLFLILLLCVWFLLPFFTSSTVRIRSAKSSTQSKPLREPLLPSSPLPPPPPPITVSSSPVVDPAVVSAAVDAKMERLLVDLQVKHDLLLSQMQEKLQLDLQVVKAQLEASDSESRLYVQQEVSGLGSQMSDYRTNSQSAAASLNLRIQMLEAQNVKLSRELSDLQHRPPPAACPEPSAAALNAISPELQQLLEEWLSEHMKKQEAIRLSNKGTSTDCGRPIADKMADFALETQGASVVSTRCSESYRIHSACVTLFGFPLWYPTESPRTVIQGHPVLLPGKCWAFHGVRGSLLISLSHPVRISHVTLDHLPRYNSPTGRIDSAPRDFEVYGLRNDTEEGTLLGTFTYDENGESTQTFQLPSPSEVVHRLVELRVLTNWGQVEYTCLYRFRVHGKMAAA